MSKENVELAHRAYDAVNRRDLDAFLALMDPEVEFMEPLMEMEGEPYYRGHSDVREFLRSLLAVFPDYKVEVLEVRDFGDSMIVGPAHSRPRPREQCALRRTVVARDQAA